MLYVETSAILRVLLKEKSFEKTAKLIEEAKICLTSSLTYLECRRAIARLTKSSLISEARASELLGIVSVVESAWHNMEITKDVQIRAGKSFDREPVRTLDAVHLATALQFRTGFPDMKVLSYDQRIISNSKVLGLELAA